MFTCYRTRTPNKRLLAAVDQDVYSSFIQEQVELLGGCKKFYEQIDRSLQNGRLEQFIMKEQKLLYRWGEKFFRKKFKCIYFGDPRPSSGAPLETTFYWETDGRDDAHCCDTVPYQITEKFDQVMRLAASTEKLDLREERIYFESNEGCEGRNIEYRDEPERFDDDEWEDEDYDYCDLLEEGKLDGDGRCECVSCEERKKRYIEYLMKNEAIKKRYWKWKDQEEKEKLGLQDEL